MEQQNRVADQNAPLQLMGSVRAKAEDISIKEGATLNEFVNVAVAEKVAHYQHMEWVKNRLVPSENGLAQARSILQRAGSHPPEAGDELPEGYATPR